MRAFREFELQAIRLMADSVLSSDQLDEVADVSTPQSYKYTGSGYFLTVSTPSLPELRRTLCEPAVVGESGKVRAGFLVYLTPGQLTLECHTWGEVDVPPDFRERKVRISTPPVTDLGKRHCR